MRWRDRTTTGTLERGEPEAPSVDNPPLERETPLSLVDEALRTIPGHDVVTRGEALELLRLVETNVHDRRIESDVHDIVNVFAGEAGDQAVVPRNELVNALLDIRLAVLH